MQNKFFFKSYNVSLQKDSQKKIDPFSLLDRVQSKYSDHPPEQKMESLQDKKVLSVKADISMNKPIINDLKKQPSIKPFQEAVPSKQNSSPLGRMDDEKRTDSGSNTNSFQDFYKDVKNKFRSSPIEEKNLYQLSQNPSNQNKAKDVQNRFGQPEKQASTNVQQKNLKGRQTVRENRPKPYENIYQLTHDVLEKKQPFQKEVPPNATNQQNKKANSIIENRGKQEQNKANIGNKQEQNKLSSTYEFKKETIKQPIDQKKELSKDSFDQRKESLKQSQYIDSKNQAPKLKDSFDQKKDLIKTKESSGELNKELPKLKDQNELKKEQFKPKVSFEQKSEISKSKDQFELKKEVVKPNELKKETFLAKEQIKEKERNEIKDFKEKKDANNKVQENLEKNEFIKQTETEDQKQEIQVNNEQIEISKNLELSEDKKNIENEEKGEQGEKRVLKQQKLQTQNIETDNKINKKENIKSNQKIQKKKKALENGQDEEKEEFVPFYKLFGKQLGIIDSDEEENSEIEEEHDDQIMEVDQDDQDDEADEQEDEIDESVNISIESVDQPEVKQNQGVKQVQLPQKSMNQTIKKISPIQIEKKSEPSIPSSSSSSSWFKSILKIQQMKDVDFDNYEIIQEEQEEIQPEVEIAEQIPEKIMEEVKESITEESEKTEKIEIQENQEVQKVEIIKNQEIPPKVAIIKTQEISKAKIMENEEITQFNTNQQEDLPKVLVIEKNSEIPKDNMNVKEEIQESMPTEKLEIPKAKIFENQEIVKANITEKFDLPEVSLNENPEMTKTNLNEKQEIQKFEIDLNENMHNFEIPEKEVQKVILIENQDLPQDKSNEEVLIDNSQENKEILKSQIIEENDILDLNQTQKQIKIEQSDIDIDKKWQANIFAKRNQEKQQLKEKTVILEEVAQEIVAEKINEENQQFTKNDQIQYISQDSKEELIIEKNDLINETIEDQIDQNFSNNSFQQNSENQELLRQNIEVEKQEEFLKKDIDEIQEQIQVDEIINLKQEVIEDITVQVEQMNENDENEIIQLNSQMTEQQNYKEQDNQDNFNDKVILNDNEEQKVYDNKEDGTVNDEKKEIDENQNFQNLSEELTQKKDETEQNLENQENLGNFQQSLDKLEIEKIQESLDIQDSEDSQSSKKDQENSDNEIIQILENTSDYLNESKNDNQEVDVQSINENHEIQEDQFDEKIVNVIQVDTIDDMINENIQELNEPEIINRTDEQEKEQPDDGIILEDENYQISLKQEEPLKLKQEEIREDQIQQQSIQSVGIQNANIKLDDYNEELLISNKENESIEISNQLFFEEVKQVQDLNEQKYSLQENELEKDEQVEQKEINNQQNIFEDQQSQKVDQIEESILNQEEDLKFSNDQEQSIPQKSQQNQFLMDEELNQSVEPNLPSQIQIKDLDSEIKYDSSIGKINQATQMELDSLLNFNKNLKFEVQNEEEELHSIFDLMSKDKSLNDEQIGDLILETIESENKIQMIDDVENQPTQIKIGSILDFMDENIENKEINEELNQSDTGLDESIEKSNFQLEEQDNFENDESSTGNLYGEKEQNAQLIEMLENDKLFKQEKDKISEDSIDQYSIAPNLDEKLIMEEKVNEKEESEFITNDIQSEQIENLEEVESEDEKMTFKFKNKSEFIEFLEIYSFLNENDNSLTEDEDNQSTSDNLLKTLEDVTYSNYHTELENHSEQVDINKKKGEDENEAEELVELEGESEDKEDSFFEENEELKIHFSEEEDAQSFKEQSEEDDSSHKNKLKKNNDESSEEDLKSLISDQSEEGIEFEEEEEGTLETSSEDSESDETNDISEDEEEEVEEEQEEEEEEEEEDDVDYNSESEIDTIDGVKEDLMYEFQRDILMYNKEDNDDVIGVGNQFLVDLHQIEAQEFSFQQIVSKVEDLSQFSPERLVGQKQKHQRTVADELAQIEKESISFVQKNQKLNGPPPKKIASKELIDGIKTEMKICGMNDYSLRACQLCKSDVVFEINDDNWYLIGIAYGYKRNFQNLLKGVKDVMKMNNFYTSFSNDHEICIVLGNQIAINSLDRVLAQFFNHKLNDYKLNPLIHIPQQLNASYFQIKVWLDEKQGITQFTDAKLEAKITPNQKLLTGATVTTQNIIFTDKQVQCIQDGLMNFDSGQVAYRLKHREKTDKDAKHILNGENLSLNVTGLQHKQLVDKMLPYYLSKPYQNMLDNSLFQLKNEKYRISFDIDDQDEEFIVSFDFMKNQ